MTDDKVTLAKTTPAGEKPKDNDLMERFAGNFSYGQDADGNPTMNSDKRSSFEGVAANASKQAQMGGSDFARKEYQTSEYAGKKQADLAKWKGAKTFSDSSLDTPDFVKKARGQDRPTWQGAKRSPLGRFAARESGATAAGVAGKTSQSFDSKTDASATQARDSTVQPERVNTDEYTKRTIEETRSIMGRKN